MELHRFPSYRLILTAAAALAALVAGPLAAFAQTPTIGSNIYIDTASNRGTVPTYAWGVNTATWDSLMTTDSTLPGLLSAVGMKTLRYPGGSWSDSYNWANNTLVPYQGYEPVAADKFDNFITDLAQKVGTGAMPIITCDYGTDETGTAGGDPAEAAAWVQYANVTHNYGVKFWEIGNEVYGSWETDLHSNPHDAATYGANVVLYAQAMKAVDPTIKVGAVLQLPTDSTSEAWNNTVLAACGSNIDFVIVHWYPEYGSDYGSSGWYPYYWNADNDAQLLADPSSIAGYVSGLKSEIAASAGTNAHNIQINVTETNADAGGESCQMVGIVNALFAQDNIASWLENGVANVDWWDLHNGVDISANNHISTTDYFGRNGFNTLPLLYFNPALYPTSSDPTIPFGDEGILSNASGAYNYSLGIDGTDTPSSPYPIPPLTGFTEPPAETPFSVYHAFEMLHDYTAPGDTMLNTTSSDSIIATHAVLNANGDLSVMVINKDPENTANANITVGGNFVPAASATTFSLGATNTAGPTQATITSAGSLFTIVMPPYSSTVVVMTPAPPSSGGGGGTTPTPTTPSQPPAFSDKTTPTPAALTGGQTGSVAVALTDNGTAASNTTVTVDIYNGSGSVVSHTVGTAQSFTSGGTNNYPVSWTAPNVSGTYIVKVSVLSSSSATYYWNPSAATITVTATSSGSPSPGNSGGSTPVNVLHSFSPGLQMVSMPYSLSSSDASSLLNGSKMATWAASAGSYVVWPTAPADSFRLGQGYWMRVGSSGLSVTTAGTPATAGQAYTVSLSAGWNLIGDPFTSAVSAGSISFSSSAGSTTSFDSAVSAGMILPWLYTYSAGDSGYTAIGPAANLQPYVGYWIFATEGLTMSVPSP